MKPSLDCRISKSQVLALLLTFLVGWSHATAQTRERRNFYGMHNLKDGGTSIPEGMNWTRHMVGEGGWVFDWVRGDYGKWVVDAMDRGLIPVLRVQDCNGGCDPNDGHPGNVAAIIRQHLETHRPEYLDRLVYFQIWNEPGDSRDFVSPARYASHLVAAYDGVKRADANDVFRVMTPGQNGEGWWQEAIRAVPAVCQAFDVWATHPYPESYPPRYNHHDGVPFINQVKTIDSYLLDLDVVGRVCDEVGSPRRGFPVMITETIYGNHLGISFEGYPKTTRGAACSPDGPCDFQMAAEYNVAAFTQFWHNWPEVLAVHPFILNNLAWDHFAFVSKTSGSRDSDPIPPWCPPQDPGAQTSWPPEYSEGAQRCGLPDFPYPQYVALLQTPKPLPASLEPYRGPVGSIRGFLRRSDTGEPVKYGTVFTDGREFGGPSLFDGQYPINDVPPGTYTLSVEKVGYRSESTTVTVQEGQEARVDFNLLFLGKVSKGIYFQNQGTCSDCDLFGPFLGQTITIPEDVGFIKFVAGMPNVGNLTIKFSVLEGGPSGPQVGPSVTAPLEWGGEMIGVEFPGDGVPVEPGQTYFVKMERTDGQGVYMYATDSNPYPDGIAYRGNDPLPGIDLFATVRGNTVAINSVAGSIEGRVEDAGNLPLAGARISTNPGNHTTTTDNGGQYLLSGIPAGIYRVTASLAGFSSQTVDDILVVENQTTTAQFTLEKDISTGAVTGTVLDPTGAPISDATVQLLPGGPSSVTDSAGSYSHTGLAPGTYDMRATKTGFVADERSGVQIVGGETTSVSFQLSPEPMPPLPDNLIANGDFSQGLDGWSVWVERGDLNPTINGGGTVHLSATGHNGGVYQTFETGGAGNTIDVSGSWASEPTIAQAQWAEVLVINGSNLPANGVDLNENTSGVVMIYKNDTWTSPGGWSGEMNQTAPVNQTGSFVATGDAATIVLKSGNLLGVSSGTLFDDIVVRGPAVVPPPPPPDNRPPISAVTADPTSGVVPLTVSFDGSASTDPDGDALTFNWTFGDGEQGSGVSVSHTYALSGTFTATLAVTDGRGGSDTSSVVITVSDSVPPPVPPSVEWDARLDTLGVFLEEADVAAGTFYWKLVSADFESDGEVLPPPGGGNESGGRHAVFVKALNEGGNPIENQKVIASWPTGNPTTAVEVFTKGPFDNFWGDFPMSGGNWCPSFPEGPRGPYGTYIGDARSDAVWGMAMPCNRHVSFRLVWQWTQKTGGDQNDPPLASASANPINGNAPLVVTLDGSVSSDPDGDPLTYTWSFGDGQAGAGAIVSHTYEQSGSFDATLTVDDGRGASASTTIRIEVGSMANAPPIAFASASTNSGTLPLTVTFDASGSSDPDGDPLSYSWDFGNGQQGSGVSVAHTYDLAGTFNVHLTVQDGRGGTDTSGITVTAISPGGGNAKSKLTIHAGFGGPLSMQFVAEAKPRIIKILDSFSAAPEIKRISPETQIIGRAFLANQPMDGDPIQRAREWWSQNANLIQQFPDVDYWEGYNEPIIQSVELMGWFAQFEAERVRILAANGLKAVIANFSVGNPDLPLWPAFYPAIDAAIAHGGILGLHEYGTPMQQHFDFASGEGWFAGRYRKVYRQFLIPEGKVGRRSVGSFGRGIPASRLRSARPMLPSRWKGAPSSGPTGDG